MFGLFAGADVQIQSTGNEVLGNAVVRPDGQVEVGLKRPLKIGDVVAATQTACAAMGAPVSSAAPIAGGRPVPLDGLTLQQTQVHPVKRCATALYFEKIMNGATITGKRTPKNGAASKIGARCLPVSPFSLWEFAPFQGDEVIVIETTLRSCNKPVGTKVTIVVDPNPPGPPTILNTICTDTTAILLGGLELSALVEVAIKTPGNPVTLHFGASAEQDSFPFSVGQPGAPTLAAGTTITVRQNLCGGPNDWSTPVSTTVHAAAPVAPKLQTPLDHATNVGLPLFLHWSDAGSAPCSQASAYNVRVGTTAVMSPADLVFAPSLAIVPTSVAVPAGVLKAGTTYFWQVRAFHPGNPVPSAWSVVFQFATHKDFSPPPPGDQTFFFCQTCPGFGQPKTISVTAPDYATAEAKAGKGVPSTCFLSPGRCA